MVEVKFSITVVLQDQQKTSVRKVCIIMEVTVSYLLISQKYITSKKKSLKQKPSQLCLGNTLKDFAVNNMKKQQQQQQQNKKNKKKDKTLTTTKKTGLNAYLYDLIILLLISLILAIVINI